MFSRLFDAFLGRKIFARDLRPGMVFSEGKVSSVTLMDGRNGNELLLRGGPHRKTAVAIKIELLDRPPIITHPGAHVGFDE